LTRLINRWVLRCWVTIRISQWLDTISNIKEILSDTENE
jgi:hypothetical protein